MSNSSLSTSIQIHSTVLRLRPSGRQRCGNGCVFAMACFEHPKGDSMEEVDTHTRTFTMQEQENGVGFFIDCLV